jgi:hypothetical protein
MSEEPKERVYAPEEIDARLKRELPALRYENGWIRRTFAPPAGRHADGDQRVGHLRRQPGIIPILPRPTLGLR